MRTPSACCLLAATLTIALAGCAQQEGDTTTAVPVATTTPPAHPTPPAPGSTRNEVMIRKMKNAVVTNKVSTARVGVSVNGRAITLRGGHTATARKSLAVTAAKQVPEMARVQDRISFASSSQPGWALMFLRAAKASSRINFDVPTGVPPPVRWGVRGFSSRALREPVFAAAISLEIEEQQSLFLLLAAEGSVNRMGNGAVDNTDRVMYIRDTQEPLFHRFMESVPDDILAHPGMYTCPGEHRGKACKLTILFALSGGRDIRLCFFYGAESIGPPQEIRDLVNNAMRLTEPWLQRWKSDIARESIDWKEIHHLLSQACVTLPESNSTARSLILRAKGIADGHKQRAVQAAVRAALRAGLTQQAKDIAHGHRSAGHDWGKVGTLLTNADASMSISRLGDARKEITYATVIAAGHLPSSRRRSKPTPGETGRSWSSGSKPWPTPWTRTAP